MAQQSRILEFYKTKINNDFLKMEDVILLLICETKVLNASMLAKALDISKEAANIRLRRIEKKNLIMSSKVTGMNNKNVFYPKNKGIQKVLSLFEKKDNKDLYKKIESLLDRSRTIDYNALEHFLDSSETYISLLSSLRSPIYLFDWYRDKQFSLKKGSVKVSPDSTFKFHDSEKTFFVEVDRATERSSRIVEKLENYAKVIEADQTILFSIHSDKNITHRDFRIDYFLDVYNEELEDLRKELKELKSPVLKDLEKVLKFADTIETDIAREGLNSIIEELKVFNNTRSSNYELTEKEEAIRKKIEVIKSVRSERKEEMKLKYIKKIINGRINTIENAVMKSYLLLNKIDEGLDIHINGEYDSELFLSEYLPGKVNGRIGPELTIKLVKDQCRGELRRGKGLKRTIGTKKVYIDYAVEEVFFKESYRHENLYCIYDITCNNFGAKLRAKKFLSSLKEYIGDEHKPILMVKDIEELKDFVKWSGLSDMTIGYVTIEDPTDIFEFKF